MWTNTSLDWYSYKHSLNGKIMENDREKRLLLLITGLKSNIEFAAPVPVLCVWHTNYCSLRFCQQNSERKKYNEQNYYFCWRAISSHSMSFYSFGQWWMIHFCMLRWFILCSLVLFTFPSKSRRLVPAHSNSPNGICVVLYREERVGNCNQKVTIFPIPRKWFSYFHRNRNSLDPRNMQRRNGEKEVDKAVARWRG